MCIRARQHVSSLRQTLSDNTVCWCCPKFPGYRTAVAADIQSNVHTCQCSSTFAHARIAVLTVLLAQVWLRCIATRARSPPTQRSIAQLMQSRYGRSHIRGHPSSRRAPIAAFFALVAYVILNTVPTGDGAERADSSTELKGACIRIKHSRSCTQLLICKAMNAPEWLQCGVCYSMTATAAKLYQCVPVYANV